jgi:RNA polymerase sigma-70 factor, ECF subfamily
VNATTIPTCVDPTPAAACTGLDAHDPDQAWRDHGPHVVRYAATLLEGDTHRAEDVAQEVALRLYRHRDVLASPGSVRGWLRTVARHIVIDLYRHDRARPAMPAGAAHELPTREDMATPDPADHILGDLEVRRLLGVLGPLHQDVVVAVHLDGLTMSGAAERLGIPVGTVKSRSHHAIARLRDHVTRVARPERPPE